MNVYINAKNGVESKLPQNFHTYYLNVPVNNLEICMSACLYVSMSLPALSAGCPPKLQNKISGFLEVF